MRGQIQVWAHRFSTIVLEGSDGVGKTSIAKILCDEHKFTLIHSPLTSDRIDLVERYRAILHLSGNLVLDRSFLSEAVYGPVFRNHSRLNPLELIELTKLVAKRRGGIIYLSASIDTLRIRLSGVSRDDNWNESTIRKLQQQYDHVLNILSEHVSIIRVNTG